MSERGLRPRLIARIRYNLYKVLRRREPWEWLRAQTEHYREVGTATRCKVCGLSIRGPLGFVNRSLWGITPLSKHPDLCNV